MLTIQPNFTQYSAKKIAFKGVSEDETAYKKRREYYESKKQEFDEILNDDFMPEGGKKVLKGFKMITEGLLEGGIVFWGAKRGASFIKDLAKGFSKSKTAAVLTDIFKPIKTIGSNIAKHAQAGIEAIKTSKFGTMIAEQYTKLITKIDSTEIGHKILEGLRAINNRFNPFKKHTVDFSKVTEKINFDNVTKATATTLGVGSGLAGAYNVARNDSSRNNITQNLDDDFDNNEELVDDIDNDEINDEIDEILGNEDVE